ncbi:hypothetical protein HDU88_000653 [Geranomyces variabilis]|nr:hypothetical protein HDU88_000653 [Geranomyces variabilis]
MAPAALNSAAKFRTWTRKALWQVVENDRERTCTTEEFSANLSAHREALREGIKWYKPSNSESRKKVTDLAVKPKAAFVLRMSKMMDLDEVQCEAILEACIKDDIEAPASRRHIDWSQLKEVDYTDEKLVIAVQQQYLNEREETLLTLAAIVRAADDEDHKFHKILREYVRTLFVTPDGGARLHAQLQIAIAGKIPPEVAEDDVWAQTWAIQYLKEQRLILQIIFLVYYSVTAYEPAVTSLITREILEGFDFGRYQANQALLEDEAATLRQHIADISVMVAVQISRVTNYQDEADELTIEGEKALKEMYLSILKKAAVASGHGEPIGPVLLSWGLLLAQVIPSVDSDDEDAEIVFPGASNAAKAAWRNPHIMIQQGYMDHAALLYLVDALQGPMVVDEHVALGYKSLIKDLISRLQCTVVDASNLPGRDIMIECMSLVFANEEQLALEWWEDDYSSKEHRSLLEAARTRFPVDFAPLVRLLTSLTSSIQAAKYVFRYFKSLTTLADFYRDHDYEEDPFADGEPGTNVFRRKTNSLGVVFGARDIYLEPPERTLCKLAGHEPPVLLLGFHYSGWHLLLSVLDSFLHEGGNLPTEDSHHIIYGTPEAVTEILDLINTFLQYASEDLLQEFMGHLSEVTTRSSSWIEKPSEHFVALICHVLNRACSLSVPPIKLLTSCMTCLSRLLPHYPDSVWKNLRVDSLFPRQSSTMGTVSSRSYMEEVLLPAEIAAGRYSTTMAFLDLVAALVKDAQTLRPQDSPLPPEEQALEAEFWEAKRNGRLMEIFDRRVGGSENRLLLEHKFTSHAGSKETAILRAEVLYSAVVYIHGQVFPKHRTWRYARIEDKFQLGLRVLQIFNLIMSDSTWSIRPEAGMKRAYLADFFAVQEYLARGYLVDGSLYQLAPLIDIVGIGSDCPLAFYRNLQIQSARATEECIEHSLQFIKFLLKRRKITGMKMSLLEHALLDKTVHDATRADTVELVQIIGRYIAYENHRPIPVLAAEVITLLCAVAADWEPRPPSFAGYLGLDVFQFVASIVKLLRNERPATSAPEELQVALYNLVTIIIATQPGLGGMLLTGESARPAIPSSIAILAASTMQEPEKEGDLSPLSVLTPALALLTNWKEALDTKPTTVPAAMRVLDALWQNAPQYMVILDKVRARAGFWTSLDEAFTDVPLDPSEEPYLGCEEFTLSQEHEDIRRYCYSKLVRTYALRILVFEIYYTNGGQDNPAVLSVAKRIFEARNEENKAILFTDGSSLPYRSDLANDVMEYCQRLDVSISLPAYKTLSWSDDLDLAAQFGDNFMYDLNLLRSKLRAHIQYHATDNDAETYADFLSCLCAINHNRSMTDAHFSMMRAWKKFIQVLVTTTQLAKEPSRAGSAGFSVEPKNSYALIVGLSGLLMAEHRLDAMVISYRSEISSLLLLLVASWGQAVTNTGTPEEHATCAADIAKRMHQCMATEHYELGPAGIFSEYPFHLEFVSGILVALRVLRANATERTFRDSAMRQTLHNLLLPLCKGLSLMLTGVGIERLKAEEAQINTVLSCLVELIGFSMIEMSTAIAIMDRHGVVPILVVVFQKAVSAPFAEYPALAEDIISAMLTIAGSSLGAERLAVENVLVCFSNNSLTPALTDGVVLPYAADQRRNSWHQIWTQILAVTTKIVYFLGSSSNLVNEITGFIRVYQNQIVRAIDVANFPDITVGRLEEMTRVTELFFALGSWADRARMSASSDSEAPDYSVLEPYSDYALQVLGYFTYLFENPHEMHNRIVTPARPELERNEHESFAGTASTAAKAGMDSVYGGDDLAEDATPPSAPLGTYSDAVHEMLLVVRNVVAYLRIATNADHLTVSLDDADWDTPNIFQATMSVHGGQSGATMGTLFGLLRKASHLFAYSAFDHPPDSPPASSGFQVEMTLFDAACRLPQDDLIVMAESALVLALTQLALYRRTAETDDMLKELVGEVEPAIKSMNAAINHAQTGPRNKSAEAAKKLARASATLKALDMFWRADSAR